MRGMALLVAQRRRRADRARRAYWRRLEATAAVLRPPEPPKRDAFGFIQSLTQAANNIVAKSSTGRQFIIMSSDAVSALKTNVTWKNLLEDPYDPYVHELKQPNCGLTCG